MTLLPCILQQTAHHVLSLVVSIDPRPSIPGHLTCLSSIPQHLWNMDMQHLQYLQHDASFSNRAVDHVSFDLQAGLYVSFGMTCMSGVSKYHSA